MKHFSSRIVVIGLLLFASSNLYSQFVGSDLFLKSNYVEMVVNGEMGVYLSDETPPVGYHFNTLSYSGMVADGDRDGWDDGVPNYCGDYFAPGSPVEGFAVQVNGDVYYNEFFNAPQIPGIVNLYNSSAGNVTSVWRGNVGSTGLTIRQVTKIHHNNTSIINRIIFVNKGDEPLYDIYYSRNVDPDQDQPWVGDFTTNNIIVQNLPVDDWALVTAEGLSYGCFLGMGSYSTTARVSYGGFSTSVLSPEDAWNGVGAHSNSGEALGDMAITVTFKLPVLNPGEIKSFTFIYGTNYDDLVDDLDFTTDEYVAKQDEADMLAEGLSSADNFDFTVSPNPTNGEINMYMNGITENSSLGIEVHNILGELVQQEQIENTGKTIFKDFSLNNTLENGAYIISLKMNDKKITRTIVLNR